MNKADFYVDKEWIGSVFKNGNIYTLPLELLIKVNKIEFEEEVIEFIEKNNGVVADKSKSKWPWDWEDSKMTNYSYIFDSNHGQVFLSIEGSLLMDPIRIRQGCSIIESNMYLQPEFPNMKKSILNIKESINGYKSTVSL